MIRFGVIGTSWITEDFIECGKMSSEFSLEAVYSRTEDKAREFAAKHQAKYFFTDLLEMAQSDVIDAVYIASPNSLHKEQSLIFINNKKHVLCEKTIASNAIEFKEMVDRAKANKVVLMEAMKSTCTPNYKVLKEALNKIGKVRRYFASYCQYSSRYDLYKEGGNPNIFNKDFSAGSVMDIGIYCIYPCIDLFGKPKQIFSSSVNLDSGVDGMGSVIMQYSDMDAVIMHSKITNSTLSCEIQGEGGSIYVDKIQTPKKIEIVYNNGQIEDLTVGQREDTMFYEVQEFINTITTNKIESDVNSHKLSGDVLEVLDEIRRQRGIIFPADLKQC